MSTRKAVYAASLDPITNGHINVIERIAPLYDEVIVLVAVDARKNYTFDADERLVMARAAVAHLSNVSVQVSRGGYVVKHAHAQGAQVIVRGLRNFKDLEDEQVLAEVNRSICPYVETIWVPCLPDLMHVSSSMVKAHVGVDPDWETQVARSVPAIVVSKLKEKWAYRHWAALMKSLGNPKHSDDVFQELMACYGETHRAYHTINHIVSMLSELELLDERSPALALAIWFHDAVYDTTARDSEERSAALAKRLIEKLELPNELAEEVSDLILVTKHSAVPTTRSAEVLIDLDLMIFGKQKAEFDAYDTNIRFEYSWVPKADYNAARNRILQSFLERPKIYYTQAFVEKYEQTARENLARAIGKL